MRFRRYTATVITLYLGIFCNYSENNVKPDRPLLAGCYGPSRVKAPAILEQFILALLLANWLELGQSFFAI